jgi:hypothetical protein
VKRAFALWRHRVWCGRVSIYRQQLLRAIDLGRDDVERLWETELNLALRRQAYWSRRAR